MNRAYLVLSEGRLLIRKLTYVGAKKEAAKLMEKGYREISIAESLENN